MSRPIDQYNAYLDYLRGYNPYGPRDNGTMILPGVTMQSPVNQFTQDMDNGLKEDSVMSAAEAAKALSTQKKRRAIVVARSLASMTSYAGIATQIQSGEIYGHERVDLIHLGLVKSILIRRGYVAVITDETIPSTERNSKTGWREPEMITVLRRKVTLTITLPEEKKPNLP